MKEADFERIDAIVESKVTAVESRINEKLNAGFNETLKYALRRVARGLSGKRDPFGTYPDDETPIT